MKRFRLVRKRVIREECYLMATDWEHAERLGHEEEQEWEHLNSHDEIGSLSSVQLKLKLRAKLGNKLGLARPSSTSCWLG